MNALSCCIYVDSKTRFQSFCGSQKSCSVKRSLFTRRKAPCGRPALKDAHTSARAHSRAHGASAGCVGAAALALWSPRRRLWGTAHPHAVFASHHGTFSLTLAVVFKRLRNRVTWTSFCCDLYSSKCISLVWVSCETSGQKQSISHYETCSRKPTFSEK